MVIGIATPARASLAERICRDCGGILDAPRPDPRTGTRARKCAGCRVFYPCAPESAAGMESSGPGQPTIELAG